MRMTLVKSSGLVSNFSEAAPFDAGGLDIIFGLACCLLRCEARLNDQDDPIDQCGQVSRDGAGGHQPQTAPTQRVCEVPNRAGFETRPDQPLAVLDVDIPRVAVAPARSGRPPETLRSRTVAGPFGFGAGAQNCGCALRSAQLAAGEVPHRAALDAIIQIFGSWQMKTERHLHVHRYGPAI
jgi:hypothetical protein